MPLDRVFTQFFGIPVGHLGQRPHSLVPLVTCQGRVRRVLALTVSVILAFEGCSIVAPGSGGALTKELMPVSRVRAPVVVGADPYVEPARQDAHLGGNSRRLSMAGLVPIRVWVQNVGDRALVVRSSEIMVELPDGGRRMALSFSGAADRLSHADEEVARGRPSHVASLRRLSPGETPSEDAIYGAGILGDRIGRVEQYRPAPEEPEAAKFTFEAPVTVWMLQVVGEVISRETNPQKAAEGVIAVLLYVLPVTLSLDLAWSAAKTGYQVIKTRSTKKARLDRDRGLERLEDVELGTNESASAVLYFPIAPPEVRIVLDAVLTVPFAEAEGHEDIVVRVPLSSPGFNRAPVEDEARDFT